jgi:NitT/TauT family transport system substrate-binding protein
MKRFQLVRMITGLVAPLFLVAAIGCDRQGTSDGTSSKSGGAAATAPAALRELRIGYFPNFTHAQAVLGVASGEFQKAVGPTKVSTKVFNAGPSLVEALFGNQIDIGYVGPGPALNAFAQSRGEGIRIISGAAANGVVIVARKDSGIEKLADLAGKRIASPQQGNTQDIAAKHYVTAELKQKDFKNVIPVANAEQAAMMSRQQIDAAWAPEPWGSFLVSEAGGKIIGQEKDLWPQGQFAITVVVTSPKFLAEHPDVVEKVLGVHNAWTTRLANEPDKHLPDLEKALFALTTKKLPAGVLKSALGYTAFTVDPLPHTFETFAGWSFDLGFAKSRTDTKGLIDTAVLQKVQASGGGASSPAPAPASAAPAKEGA